jgi:hypothetical protein
MQNLYDAQISSDDPDIFMLQLLKSILHILKSYHSNRHQNTSAVAS